MEIDLNSVLSALIVDVPVIGVLLWIIKWLRDDIRTLKDNLSVKDAEAKEHAQDYRKMIENSIKIITLAEDKLKDYGSQSFTIKTIHGLVVEIKDIVSKRV
jgi:hypothetical protein